MQNSLFEREVAKFDRMRPLRPRQLQAITSIKEAIKEGHKRIILQAPTGFGKCHGAGTEVIMYDGSLRKVEDVRPGERLMGPDSLPRTVLNTVQGYGPLYVVTPKKGEPFVCNDVHVLSLKRTNIASRGASIRSDCMDGQVVNIALNEYIDTSKTFKHIHKLWRTGIECPEAELSIDPYFMGVLLGDGSIVTSIGVTTMDKEIVDVIYEQAKLFGLEVRKADQEGNQSSTYFFHGGGKHCQLRHYLWWYGLHGAKCGDKFIPQDYLTASRSQRLQLLAGLIDTDGHVFSNHRSIEFANKSLRIIEGFEFLVRSLGFGCARCQTEIKGVTYYRVHVHGDYSVIPSRIPRKQVTKPRFQKKDVLLTGFDVEFIGNGDYYGFALDGDHLYLLRDFTVTHNTLTAAHIIAAALRKGTRPLFTCPAISLVDQTLASFEAEGIHDIGVMQAQHARTNYNATVQIASVQTLIKRQAPNVGFAMIDEVHEGFDGLDALLDSPEWANKIVIGLSATPWARGMGNRWTKLVIAGTINDMIAEGHACPSIIYGPDKDLNREALKVERGEFADKSAGEAMSDKTIIGDVLKEWRERSPREKTFGFCVNRDHAKQQLDAFTDAGIPFGYIDALVNGDERKRIFAQMKYGEIAGILSVGCLIRGVDEDVRCILDLQPTKSEMRHVQKWGRGVRMAEGKTVLIGLDHAGNNQSLGLFTDIYHDTLDTRAPGERGEAYKDDAKPAKPRKCPKCHNLVPPGVRSCPTCLERLPLHSGVTMKDGRLVEISSLPKPNKEHQRIYSELLHVARKSGFKDGWAAFKFQSMVGVMPNGLKPRGKSSTSDDVKEFAKAERKKYMESKKAVTV